ncbi:MAG TPA: histidine kinase dimerization/phospho-acceptor domain-containing protein, partial [Thermoanaerobaculia bacterium]|nr:histidine kinase dimerization/phospho-acceptor domain-containing protein [Thermoanaerobaculia bacterium]
MLWGAFAALTILVAAGIALTLLILQNEHAEETRIVAASEPLIDSMQEMNAAITTAVAAARGYVLTHQTEFTQQYDDAVRDFEHNYDMAKRIASDPQDISDINEFRKHFETIKPRLQEQVDSNWGDDDRLSVLSVAKDRRAARDYVGTFIERHRHAQTIEHNDLDAQRQWVMLLMILIGVAIIAAAAVAITRIERSIIGSIEGQVRRTEAMIAGMADGVMLVDADGRTVFINPAGEKLLGRTEIGVPIFKQPDVYHLRNDNSERINPDDLPAAQALATGRSVHDKTMLIERDGRNIAISMSATPLHEDRRTTGAIVTFRDITERRKLEDEMQLQAERAQTLADAGAFFSSNIDPVWVTQAIAERVAEVLGDWAAVIMKSIDSNELRVASIYHRDMASLGLAWSYIYRQPLLVGEGIIGQVVATGFPSLTTNIAGTIGEETGYRVGTSQHANPMKLASLLILPLRTRREMLGAIVIAANDPVRVMTDEKLPLAEVLAERAALAIENAKLYTEQVEARRKVEDLSRLKDEFLSIASHELRTPVTSIKGYTQLAKTLIRENDLATSEEYLDIALDQIDRMSRLILELLDVSRIETGRLEIRRDPIDWSTFVRDVVHRHHTAVSDRRFHVGVPSHAPMVKGDRDRLEQVLGNLLENAVKYSPEGSEIFVS